MFYVGPKIDIPLSVVFWLHFIAIQDATTEEWVVTKNRFDGRTGVMDKELIDTYVKLLLK